MRKAEASKMRATAKRMLGVDLLRSKMGEVMERTDGKTRSMWGRIRWSPVRACRERGVIASSSTFQ